MNTVCYTQGETPNLVIVWNHILKHNINKVSPTETEKSLEAVGDNLREY
jgi:hypothetical protein